MQSLDLQPPFDLVATVEGVVDLSDQQAVLRLGGEIPAASQDQLLLQPVFPVPVRTQGSLEVMQSSVPELVLASPAPPVNP